MDRGGFWVKRVGGDGPEVVAEGGGSSPVRGGRAGGWRLVAFLFAEEFEPLAVEPQGFVPLFAAAQGESHFHQILHDDHFAVEDDFRCFLHFPEQLREHGRKGDEEMFAGNVGDGHPRGVLGEVADVFDAGTVIEPLLVGALPPFGQILLGDEPVLEEPFHVMSHRRVRVEPTQDLFGGDVFHELVIELLADVERQSGYLTFSCSHVFWRWYVVCFVERGREAKSGERRGVFSCFMGGPMP